MFSWVVGRLTVLTARKHSDSTPSFLHWLTTFHPHFIPTGLDQSSGMRTVAQTWRNMIAHSSRYVNTSSSKPLLPASTLRLLLGFSCALIGSFVSRGAGTIFWLVGFITLIPRVCFCFLCRLMPSSKFRLWIVLDDFNARLHPIVDLFFIMLVFISSCL